MGDRQRTAPLTSGTSPVGPASVFAYAGGPFAGGHFAAIPQLVPATVLRRMQAADSAILVVTGLPGVGKTTWCRALVEAAGPRQALVCGADQLLSDQPWALVERLARALALTARVIQGTDADDPAVVATTLIQAIRRRRRPLTALVIDDIQWIDDASAMTLRMLLPLLADEHLIVVLSGDTGAGERMADYLVRGGGVSWGVEEHLEIPPLTPAMVQEYVAHAWERSLSARAAARLAEISGGLPLLIDASMRRLPKSAQQSQNPTGADRDDIKDHPWLYEVPMVSADLNPFREVVAHLAEPRVRTAVDIVSVLRVGAPAATIHRVAQCLGESVDLEGAIALDLLVAEDVGEHRVVSPRRGLLASAAVDLLPLDRTNRIHEAIATVIDDPQRALAHELAVVAPGTDELADRVLAAIDTAVAKGRRDQAQACARAALPRFDGPLRARLVLEICVLAMVRHTPHEVMDLLPEVLAMPAEPVRDGILMGLYQPLPHISRTIDLAGEHERSVAGHPDADLFLARAAVVSVMMALASWNPAPIPGLIAEGWAHVERYRTRGGITDPRVRHLWTPSDLALQLHGYALAAAAQTANRREIEAALGGSGAALEAAPDSPSLADALTCRAALFFGTGMPEQAAADAERALGAADAACAGLARGHTRVVLAASYVLLGRLDAAQAVLRDAIAVCLDVSDVSSRPLVWQVSAWVHALRGESEEYAAALARAAQVWITEYSTLALDVASLAAAEWARVRGSRIDQLTATAVAANLPATVALLARLRENPDAALPEGPVPTLVRMAAYRIDALAALGRAEEAECLLTLCRRYEGRGWGPSFGTLTWLEGRVAQAHGAAEQALASYRAATTEASLPLPRGQTWLDLARLLIAEGEQREGLAAARMASQTFREIGATAYLEVSEELAASVEPLEPGVA